MTTQPKTIIVTDAAAEKLYELLLAEKDPALKLRIFIAGGGCGGHQFGFSFENEVMENDIVIEKPVNSDTEIHQVSLLIDSASLPYLQGATIDFSRDDACGEQFIIRNANLPKGGCGGGCSGCGGGCS